MRVGSVTCLRVNGLACLDLDGAIEITFVDDVEVVREVRHVGHDLEIFGSRPVKIRS